MAEGGSSGRARFICSRLGSSDGGVWPSAPRRCAEFKLGHYRLALIEVDAALQRVDQAKYASGVATTNAIVGIILGFPLAVFGFWAWYVKLQRPMDDLLAAQLATEKREDGPSPPSQ